LLRIEGDRLRITAIDDPDDAKARAPVEAYDRLLQWTVDARVRSALARPVGRATVVDDVGVERQRLVRRDGSRRTAFDFEGRRVIGFAELAGTAPVLLVDARVKLPDRHQRSVRLFGLPARRQRPDEIFPAPVLRDADFEDELLPARVEMRRLPLILRARV